MVEWGIVSREGCCVPPKFFYKPLLRREKPNVQGVTRPRAHARRNEERAYMDISEAASRIAKRVRAQREEGFAGEAKIAAMARTALAKGWNPDQVMDGLMLCPFFSDASLERQLNENLKSVLTVLRPRSPDNLDSPNTTPAASEEEIDQAESSRRDRLGFGQRFRNAIDAGWQGEYERKLLIFQSLKDDGADIDLDLWGPWNDDSWVEFRKPARPGTVRLDPTWRRLLPE